MSIDVIRPCMELSLPGELKFTLITLASFANKTGTNAYPSVARLAHMCGKSPRSIKKHLSDLRARGLIEVIAWPDRPGRATHYRFNMAKIAREADPYVKTRDDQTVDDAPPDDPIAMDGYSDRPETGETHDQRGVSFNSKMGEAGDTLTTMEPPYRNPPYNPPEGDENDMFGESPPPSKPKPANAEAPYSPDFERWWRDAWPRHPRKQSKSMAWKRYREALKRGYTPDQLFRAAKAAEAHERARNGDLDYLPAPEVWLNKRRYEGFLDGSVGDMPDERPMSRAAI